MNTPAVSLPYHSFLRRLAAVYAPREAQALLRMACEEALGMAWTEVLTTDFATHAQRALLESIVARLLRHEPIQYILGMAMFCGAAFAVDSSVLIPRPETEDLVAVVEEQTVLRAADPSVRCLLDIGTGSGCIALTLARHHPSWRVAAWDNSAAALRVAAANASRQGITNVCFAQEDILQERLPNTVQWDTIVANPPYVCLSERATMDENVLSYEPAAALFVPDDDPLLFFRAIARYAAATLRHNGQVFLEVNTRYASAVAALLADGGFSAVSLRADRYGRERIVFATYEEPALL